jgi:anti-sigma regulatory factor (Ser/Thr protein kinase)
VARPATNTSPDIDEDPRLTVADRAALDRAAGAVHAGAFPTDVNRLAVPAQARRLIRNACAVWNLTSEQRDDLTTISSELVVNAVEHTASSTVTVAARRWSPELVIVRVHDDQHRPPVTRTETEAGAEYGRGLVIVRALAELGWYPLEPAGGKVVWAAYHPRGDAASRLR